MQSVNNKTIIIGVIGAGIVGGLIWLAVMVSRPQAGSKGDYYDKNSGQTVSNNGQSPQTYGTVDGQPIFLGISNLTDIGVSKFQIAGIKTAFTKYSTENNLGIKEVSIGVKSIKATPHDPNSSSIIDSVTFNVIIDRRTTYKARVDYSNISVIRLVLSKTDGEQVFDSGDIDSTDSGD